MALVHESISDFVHFPKEHPYSETFPSHSGDTLSNMPFNPVSSAEHQRHFSEVASATYSTYPSVGAFSESSSYYSGPNFVLDAPKESLSRDRHPFSPSVSPSPTTSHSFNNPPSTLSSTSEPSAHSTASSTMGSPYSHAAASLPGQDSWTELQHGLGIAPSVLQHDTFGHKNYLSGHGENELTLDENRYPESFVGESRQISSSSFLPSQTMQSSVSSCATSPNFISLSSLSQSKKIAAETPGVTIDSILEEVNRKMDPSQLRIDPNSASLGTMSPSPPLHGGSFDSPIDSPGPFKSPTTPASANCSSGGRTASPVVARYHEFYSNSKNSSTTCLQGQENTTSPSEAKQHSQAIPPSPRPHGLPQKTPSPSSFFNQSSGRFIPPLQSSCWFSFVLSNL